MEGLAAAEFCRRRPERNDDMEKGKIVQVLGPVIDVAFPGKLPMIKDALTVDNGGKTCVMEVAQHMGNGIVRCISLSSTEGLCKGYGSPCDRFLH